MSSYYMIEEAAHLARLFGDGNFIEKSAMGKGLIPAISGFPPSTDGLKIRKIDLRIWNRR